MKVLIIGGTGLISTGIVKHLLQRDADITLFNRAQRQANVDPRIKSIVGDRNQFDAFERQFADSRFDVVIDMICFNAEQAQSDVRAFGSRCEQFIFCSTVCTYGVKVPPGVLVDETFPQKPISSYGQNKVACEKVFRAAHEAGKFKATIIRPSHTYGAGNALIDNLEGDAVAWDRIEKDMPVLCAGDGLGLWVSTHRDDVGKLFAHAAMNPRTFGQEYNATRPDHFTWRQYYAEVAAVLGRPAKLLFLPASFIARHDPNRFGLLREITAFHGAYDSSKARRDVPQFKCEIDLKTGAAEVFADARRRGAWKNSDHDSVYEKMVVQAEKLGMEPEPA